MSALILTFSPEEKGHLIHLPIPPSSLIRIPTPIGFAAPRQISRRNATPATLHNRFNATNASSSLLAMS
ncbi:MAG: hypothetical protein ABI042_17235 [Verrucomicrobiota bacterium]